MNEPVLESHRPYSAAGLSPEGRGPPLTAWPTLALPFENAALAKPNYSFEKRQREIAKKKQQDEKLAKKKEAREAAKTTTPATAGTGRDGSDTGR